MRWHVLGAGAGRPTARSFLVGHRSFLNLWLNIALLRIVNLSQNLEAPTQKPLVLTSFPRPSQEVCSSKYLEGRIRQVPRWFQRWVDVPDLWPWLSLRIQQMSESFLQMMCRNWNSCGVHELKFGTRRWCFSGISITKLKFPLLLEQVINQLQRNKSNQIRLPDVN